MVASSGRERDQSRRQSNSKGTRSTKRTNNKEETENRHTSSTSKNNKSHQYEKLLKSVKYSNGAVHIHNWDNLTIDIDDGITSKFDDDESIDVSKLLKEVKKAKRKDQKERYVRDASNRRHQARSRCQYKEKGGLCKNERCRFDHNFDVPKVPQVCRYYVTNSCNHGKNCTHMHSEFPCRYFHIRKFCYNDKDCKFSHEPLTEVGKKIIDDIKHELNVKKYEKECEPQLYNAENFNENGNDVYMTYDDQDDADEQTVPQNNFEYFDSNPNGFGQCANFNDNAPLPLGINNMHKENIFSLMPTSNNNSNAGSNNLSQLDSVGLHAVYNPYADPPNSTDNESPLSAKATIPVHSLGQCNPAENHNSNFKNFDDLMQDKREPKFVVHEIENARKLPHAIAPPAGYSNQLDPRLIRHTKRIESSILPFLGV